MPKEEKKTEGVRIFVPSEIVKGVYANQASILHTAEEFFMDFMIIAKPHATITARVITSPGCMKRILIAIQENVRKYEKKYKEIPTSAELPEVEIIESGKTLNSAGEFD